MSGLHLLYVLGVPGSGKTTLVRQLVLGRRRRVFMQPFAHTVYEDGLVQLGRDRAGHGGTDALSMSVQPAAIAALVTNVWPRVLAEGDRLANGAFFEAAREAGYEVTVALYDVAPEVAAARRAARGTHQDETWLRGRESKLAKLLPYVTLTLDGTVSPAEHAILLARHPVLSGRNDKMVLPNDERNAC